MITNTDKCRYKSKMVNMLKKYSLSEIAEMVGYQDGASLSHAFKKAYGVSPKSIDMI